MLTVHKGTGLCQHVNTSLKKTSVFLRTAKYGHNILNPRGFYTWLPINAMCY